MECSRPPIVFALVLVALSIALLSAFVLQSRWQEHYNFCEAVTTVEGLELRPDIGEDPEHRLNVKLFLASRPVGVYICVFVGCFQYVCVYVCA
jgi:hypothetical protein